MKDGKGMPDRELFSAGPDAELPAAGQFYRHLVFYCCQYKHFSIMYEQNCCLMIQILHILHILVLRLCNLCIDYFQNT